MKTIITTNGYKVFVDDIDFKYLNQFVWQYAQITYCRSVIRLINKGKKYIPMRKDLIKCEQGEEVIYLDGNRLNHCKDNLKKVTKSQLNRMQPPRNNKYKGVFFDKQKSAYTASININGTPCYLETSDNIIKLAKLYDSAAYYIAKEYAYFNFPNNIKPLSEKLKIKINKMLGVLE